MNKTQKTAWFNLATALLSLATIACILIKIFLLKSFPEGFGGYFPLVAYGVILVAAHVVMRKKQSPAEVDKDERDKLIEKNAVLVSFVSVFLLLYTSVAILWFIIGGSGLIPVYLLVFINLGVFFIAGAIFCIAVIVQYSRRGKDGQQ